MRRNYTSTGISPLEARATKGINDWLIYPFFLIVLFAIIFVFHKMRKARHATPEWIAAQKKRMTTKKDCAEVAKRYSLSKSEQDFLFEICKKTKAPNISYTIGNDEKLDAVFRACHNLFLKESAGEKKITKLFLLRRKIEEVESSRSVITSTAGLSEGLKITCITPRGTTQCILKKNTKENMSLSVPQSFFTSEAKPAPLAKCSFMFTTQSYASYLFIARVIRYDKAIDNSPEMIIAHTNDVKQQTRRKSKRRDIDLPCTFARIDGNKTGESMNGLVKNISDRGCCIASTGVAAKNEMIALSLVLREKPYTVFGKIVGDRTNKMTNTHLLNVAFVKIDFEARNRIFSYVYGYAPDEKNLNAD